MIFFNRSKKNFIFTVLCLFFFPCRFFAQVSAENVENQDSLSQFTESILDYIDIFQLLTDTVPEEDFGPNPYLLPPVFSGKFMRELPVQIPPLLKEYNPLAIPMDSIYLQSEGKRYVDLLRRKSFYDLLYNHVELVKYTKSSLPNDLGKIDEIKPDLNQPILKVD